MVAHLPLTAIHQRDAVFGRVPAAGMTRTNADGTAVQPRRGRYDGAMIEFVAVQMGQSQFFPNLGECQWRCVADTYEAGHAVCAVGPVHYSMIELAGCRRHRKGLLRSAEPHRLDGIRRGCRS